MLYKRFFVDSISDSHMSCLSSHIWHGFLIGSGNSAASSRACRVVSFSPWKVFGEGASVPVDRSSF